MKPLSHYLLMLVGFKRNERGCSGGGSSQTKQVAMDASNQRQISKSGPEQIREGWNIKGRKTV